MTPKKDRHSFDVIVAALGIISACAVIGLPVYTVIAKPDAAAVAVRWSASVIATAVIVVSAMMFFDFVTPKAGDRR